MIHSREEQIAKRARKLFVHSCLYSPSVVPKVVAPHPILDQDAGLTQTPQT